MLKYALKHAPLPLTVPIGFSALVLLASCAAFQSANTAPTPAQVTTVTTTANAIGGFCAIIPEQLSPSDLAKAQSAAANARLVLTSASPTIATLQAALTADVPGAFGQVGTSLVAFLNTLNTDIAPGTLANDAATAFLNTCQADLGTPAAASASVKFAARKAAVK